MGRPPPRRAWIVSASLVALAVACVSCRRAAPEPPAAQDDEGRFPHASHQTVACTECHPEADVLAGKPARPGADDHAPCDRDQCHQAAFVGPPQALCSICHERVDPRGGGTTPALYPPRQGSIMLAAEFDHRRHLDFAAMERAVGFHVSCSDCHVDDEAAVTRPGHTACARCHAPEAAPENAPPLTECAACHKTRRVRPMRARRLIIGDLRFAHQPHRVDRNGKPIRCVTCHVDSPAHSGTGGHPVPQTQACVSCHDDSSRVPQTRRMRVCETCHSSRLTRVGSLAPRSHLPKTERPLDHTIAFRRDHEAEAVRDPTRCARCHTVVSGSQRDVCDECHGVMRPVDHRVTWREYDHGQEAATDANRCSTCHSGDFCVACHTQTPRSHFPLVEFVAGGHGTQAMLNMRACITCHPQQTVCSRSGCHPGPR